MKPRGYQIEAAQSIFDYFDRKSGNPIVAMPTGTGKSVVIGEFLKVVFAHWPTQRVLVLTHVKELVEQNAATLGRVWPTAPIGVYSAGLDRKELHAPITFAGVQSLINAVERMGRIDLVIIDECHLVSPSSNTMYRRLIDALTRVNPLLKVIGFSATPYRLGQGRLIEPGSLFTDLCYDGTSKRAYLRFFEEGWLVKPVPRAMATTIDVSGVKILAGDFSAKGLEQATDRKEITEAVVDETVAQLPDRNRWLVFAAGVDHAHHVTEALRDRGIAAEAVHGGLTAEARDGILDDFREGRIQAVVNNNILTTGFDLPSIDAIVMLRATSSPGLWVQMLGRGTRPVYPPGYPLDTPGERLGAIAASSKPDCVVLDFAGNTKRLGPINDPVVPKPRQKGKQTHTAPVRICELCNAFSHAGSRFCDGCGFEFPRPQRTPHLTPTASQSELLATENPKVVNIVPTKISFSRHVKPERPDSVKVTYHAGMLEYRKWLCFEHGGHPAHLARRWWRNHVDDFPPDTVEDALVRLRSDPPPIRPIKVWVNREHPEILED